MPAGMSLSASDRAAEVPMANTIGVPMTISSRKAISVSVTARFLRPPAGGIAGTWQ